MIRVLISAESPSARERLEALVAASPAVTLVTSEPDVLLVQGESVAEITEHATPTVLLTNNTQSEWSADMLRSGVRAILPPDATAAEITAAIEAAAAGLIVLLPESVQSLLSRDDGHAPAMTQEQALTPREIEVLSMLAEGLGNKIIAWRLGVSEHTIKFHIRSIFTKLNASSRTEAVTIGYRRGLILL